MSFVYLDTQHLRSRDADIQDITGVVTIDGLPYPPEVIVGGLGDGDIPVGSGTTPPLKNSGTQIVTQLAVDGLGDADGHLFVPHPKVFFGHISHVTPTIGPDFDIDEGVFGIISDDPMNPRILAIAANGSATGYMFIGNLTPGGDIAIQTRAGDGGNIKIVPKEINPTVGQVLTSDKDGNAIWKQPPAGNFFNSIPIIVPAGIEFKIPFDITTFNNIPDLTPQNGGMDFTLNNPLVGSAVFYQVTVNVVWDNSQGDIAATAGYALYLRVMDGPTDYGSVTTLNMPSGTYQGQCLSSTVTLGFNSPTQQFFSVYAKSLGGATFIPSSTASLTITQLVFANP